MTIPNNKTSNNSELNKLTDKYWRWVRIQNWIMTGLCVIVAIAIVIVKIFKG